MKSTRKKEKPTEWLGTKAISERFDIPQMSLAKGFSEGRMPPDRVKKVGRRWMANPENFLEHWFANTDTKQLLRGGLGKHSAATVGKIQKGKSKPGRPASTSGKLVEYLNLEGTSDDMLAILREKLSALTGPEVRVAKEAAQTLKLEIEIAQMRNQLIDKDEAYAEMYAFGQRVRQRLEAIPKRIVDNIMAEDDRVEVQRMLRDAIDDALLSLTDTPELKNPE
jgi:hypothetical protein